MIWSLTIKKPTARPARWNLVFLMATSFMNHCRAFFTWLHFLFSSLSPSYKLLLWKHLLWVCLFYKDVIVKPCPFISPWQLRRPYYFMNIEPMVHKNVPWKHRRQTFTIFYVQIYNNKVGKMGLPYLTKSKTLIELRDFSNKNYVHINARFM